jgi:hypothetical protein
VFRKTEKKSNLDPIDVNASLVFIFFNFMLHFGMQFSLSVSKIIAPKVQNEKSPPPPSSSVVQQ